MGIYLSIRELADRWGVGKSTVRRMLARGGTIVGIRINGQARITIESVERYEREHPAQGRAAS